MYCETQCELVTLYGYTRVLLCANLVFFISNILITTKLKSLISHVTLIKI